jgi:Putative zinc-finger
VKPTGRDRDPAFDRLIADGLAREVGVSGNACPDADLLAAWFDHALSAPENERIEAHAAGCAYCQQLVAALARSEPVVVRAAPLPAPARPWHWHWRWLVPLATAAVVVVLGTRTLRAPGPVTVPASTMYGQKPATTVELVTPSTSPAAAAPPRAKAAPAPTPAAGVVPPALTAESHIAEQEKRPADVASDKMLKVGAPAAALAAPSAPPANEPMVVAGGAPRQSLGTLNVRQASLTTLMLSGSAVAWRFGQDGVIEKSADRGQTWVRQSSGVTSALFQASAPSDTVCWMVGADGVVLRTTDGQTWQRLNAPTAADLVAVHAWSESSATITASDRSMYETSDGGRSWRRR